MDGMMLLNQAKAADLTVMIDGEGLRIRGPKHASHIAERLIEHKPDVMAILRNALPGNRNRSAQNAEKNHLPLPNTSKDSIRAEADQLVSDAVRHLNLSCPPDWRPTPENWKAIDAAEAEVTSARHCGDRETLVKALAAYIATSREQFRSDSAPHHPPVADSFKTPPQGLPPPRRFPTKC